MIKLIFILLEAESIMYQGATNGTTTSHPISTSVIKVELTARQIFAETHKDLVIAGEKWMKEAASSYTVVGALIITITFAAAFTFPVGDEQVSRVSNGVFMISNGVALSASNTSALTF